MEGWIMIDLIIIHLGLPNITKHIYQSELQFTIYQYVCSQGNYSTFPFNSLKFLIFVLKSIFHSSYFMLVTNFVACRVVENSLKDT